MDPTISDLTQSLRALLDEDAPPGTKHKWADGRTYVKQRDGSWEPEAGAKKAPLALPAHTGPEAGKSAGAKAEPVQASADHLPDEPDRYFHKTAKSKVIPVSLLRTIRARPEGIKHAAELMAMAYNGKGQKRKPVSLKSNEDGTYTVTDGNSTTAMARHHGWKNIIAHVDGEGEEGAAHHESAGARVLAMEELLAERTYKVGTVRKWGGIQFKKASSGDWERLPGKGGGGPPTSPTGKKLIGPSHGGAAGGGVGAGSSLHAKVPVHTFTRKTSALIAKAKAAVATHAGNQMPAATPPAAASHASDEPSHSEIGAKVPGLSDLVKSGKLAAGKTLEDHVKIGKEFLGKHAANLDKSISKLKAMMPQSVEVKGRTKALDSALGKLVRKPKYGSVDKLQDGTGMRVIAPDTETLQKSVDTLKKNYKIIDQDDYISKPLGGDKGFGYRSFHAIIQDDDGLQKEVQLRTPNQNTHADWSHDIYKPHTKEQETALAANTDEIMKYSRDMGDYFEKLDKKQEADKPPCPEPVVKHFTCL